MFQNIKMSLKVLFFCIKSLVWGIFGEGLQRPDYGKVLLLYRTLTESLSPNEDKRTATGITTEIMNNTMTVFFSQSDVPNILTTFLFVCLFIYFVAVGWVCNFIIWDIEPIHPLKSMTNMLFVNSAEGLGVFFSLPATDLFTAWKIGLKNAVWLMFQTGAVERYHVEVGTVLPTVHATVR